MENIKGFIKSRPPVVVFGLGLAAFSIILSLLAVSGTKENIINPDEHEDWNVFLEFFSKLEFCSSGNTTSYDDLMNSQDHKHVKKEYSVEVMLLLRPTIDFVKSAPSHTHSMMHGRQLGVKGLYATADVDVFFKLPTLKVTDLKCDEAGHCKDIPLKACVTFWAASDVFPQTNVPKSCLSNWNEAIKDTEKSKNGVVILLHWHHINAIFSTYRCRSSARIIPQYKMNPKLTVMLTETEKYVMRRNLLLTSLVNALLVLLMIFYAAYKGEKHYYRPVRHSICEEDSGWSQSTDL